MPKSSLRLRLSDFAVISAVAAVYACAWASLPEELIVGEFRCRCHASVLVFGAMASLASYFVILLIEEQVTVASEHPAAWLAAQVVLWNPLAWLWLVHHGGSIATELLGDDGLPLAVGLLGVVLWGGATSLAAWRWCSSRRWRGVFVGRFFQALVTGFAPTWPALAFLAFLAIVYQATINRRYDAVHHLALRLVAVEQVVATVWLAAFSNVNTFG